MFMLFGVTVLLNVKSHAAKPRARETKMSTKVENEIE